VIQAVAVALAAGIAFGLHQPLCAGQDRSALS